MWRAVRGVLVLGGCGWLVEACKLGFRYVEADGEAFGLAMPSVVLGLVDPLRQVTNDFDEAVPLAWVDAQHRASDAGLTEMILK